MAATTNQNVTVVEDEGTWIPDCNLPAFEAALAKLNKRAAKLGVAPADWDLLGEERRQVFSRATGEPIPGATRLWLKVLVRGEAPKLNGWTFIGTIDFSDPAVDGFALRMVPGEAIPERYRNAAAIEPTRCDHCKASRKRNLTYIVRHDDGRLMQVGSGCLKDFLGHKSPQAVANMLSYVRELAASYADEPAGWGGGHAEWTFELAEFLTACATSARTCGYMTASAARDRGGCSTGEHAWQMLIPGLTPQEQRIREDFYASSTDADNALARAALAWMPSMWEGKADTQLSDFVRNLRAYTGKGIVSYKSKGFAAAVIGCYQREVEKEARLAAEKRAPANNAHIGEQGKRVDLAGCTVASIRYIESYYGTKTLVKMRAAGGECLVWWASCEVDEAVTVGATVDVRGTVKKHGEYQGTKETTLTRCALTVR